MFEIFEPLIRQNCGKFFTFATIGFLSSVYFGFNVASSAIKYALNFF